MTIVSSERLDRWARKAVAAAARHDEFGTLRALAPVGALSDRDMFAFCRRTAGMTVDMLAVHYARPLGPGWLFGSEQDRRTAVQRFALDFLTASAELDPVRQLALWEEQLRFARVAYSAARDTRVASDAVVALVARCGEQYRGHGETP